MHSAIYNVHHEKPDVNMCASIWMPWSLYGASPRRLASLLLGGRIIYEEAHWFTACPCLPVLGFRAASVKLMSQAGIKEALTSLNYTYCKIKYAGLFERNNVTAWQTHVIFSMLLERGPNIFPSPFTAIFNLGCIWNDCTVCAWMKKLTLFLFVRHCNQLALLMIQRGLQKWCNFA